MIDPFVVDVPGEVLTDLRDRLRATRWPDQLPGTEWDYGTDLEYLRELCEYWADGFDWRAAEQRLNKWPQFTTEIDGQRIHFIHARAGQRNAVPLLVLHGWPGSVAEMLPIIELLRDPTSFGDDGAGFDVVCVSLPGFGFSGPTRDTGWHVRRIAAAMVELMARLGYDRFGALGGDWGATTCNFLGLDFPERLHGIYLTMAAAGPPEGFDFLELNDRERAWVTDSAEFFVRDAGYMQIQGTRPQTLAYAMNDSPAGLAGWIVEKFRGWSDCSGDLESAISRDDLLTNITIYWVTQTANSSFRIYLETMRAGQFQPIAIRIDVPTGCAIFPKEVVRSPRAWAELAWDLRHWTEMPKGGHFPALEVPELLAPDVHRFFRALPPVQ
ncbi:MAG TPA: epoxide hydrolase [Acidimicrobiales bacterium]|nr:epoxide hydrolase [Acidimicrobiales bacterium]